MVAKSRNTTPRRRRTNNNPSGNNQYTGTGSRVSDHPLVTAAVVTGAAAAGLFLWSRRNELSEQISSLSDQLTEWSDAKFPGIDNSFASMTGGSDRPRTQSEIAEEALTLKATGDTF